MSEQWPREHQASKQEFVTNPSFKTEQDFLGLRSAFHHVLLKDFDDVVSWIVKQNGDLAELEQRISQLIDKTDLQTIQDSETLLMTHACAAALAKYPSLQTWSKVNTKYHSWQLEHWLAEAMMAYAKINPDARNAYTELAKEAFSALDNFTLQSKSARINEERSGAWAYYKEQHNKLDEIWWGLRGCDGFMNYKEELPLFRVLYELNPSEFISIIKCSSNPYLVKAFLFVAGIGAFSPKFSEWKRMIAAAPVAFEDDGRWNGSVLMPLLLVEARNQLLQAAQCNIDSGLYPNDIDKIKQKITRTAELIATTIYTCSDAPAIFSRWLPWLMRQILGHTSKEISDVKSSAFADNVLINAIGNKLKNQTVPQASPKDAALWENWCYLCTLASFAAYNKNIKVLCLTDFLDEWRLSPEDWMDNKGHLLREHASLITTLNKETPGIAANWLAYPIAQSNSPAGIWISLWDDAITLREIVEFGDVDATKDEYKSRSEAGQLLLLLFRIGLATFDQGAAKCCNSNSPEDRSLVHLYKALASATLEMREIDNMLNCDEWLMITQHLAVRRMIWERSAAADNEDEPRYYQVFKTDDTPTIADFLTEAKGDVIELVAILQSLLLNSPNTVRLKEALHTALIDISGILDSIRNLNQYHPHKYHIDEAQLQKLESLCEPF